MFVNIRPDVCHKEPYKQMSSNLCNSWYPTSSCRPWPLRWSRCPSLRSLPSCGWSIRFPKRFFFGQKIGTHRKYDERNRVNDTCSSTKKIEVGSILAGEVSRGPNGITLLNLEAELEISTSTRRFQTNHHAGRSLKKNGELFWCNFEIKFAFGNLNMESITTNMLLTWSNSQKFVLFRIKIS